MPKEWNPRYTAYCRVHGQDDPETMLDRDREKYPGGCMCGFIVWIQERWYEFDKLNGVLRYCVTSGSQEYHDKFDLWLKRQTNA